MNRAARTLLVRALERQTRIRDLVLATFEVVPGQRVRKTAVAEVIAADRKVLVSPLLVAEVTRVVLGIPGVRALRPQNKSMFIGLRRRGHSAQG